MFANDALKRLAASKKLPPGHTGKKEAQEAVDEIYRLTREKEKDISRRIKKFGHHFDKDEAQTFCNYACDALGIKNLVIVYEGCPEGAGGACGGGKMYLHPYNKEWVDVITILHELAHHVCSQDSNMDMWLDSTHHKGNFLWVEDLLADTYIQYRQEERAAKEKAEFNLALSRQKNRVLSL